MFIGSYRHQLDEKMRIRIPVKLKAELGEKPFITIGSNNSLILYKNDDGERMLQEIYGKVNEHDPIKNRAMRMLASSGFFADEDKQGRIILPQAMLKHAKINKKIVTIGAVARVEIWSEEVWDEYTSDEEMTFDECLALLTQG